MALPAIKITTKLTRNQQQRLRRAAQRDYTYFHLGRNLYAAQHDFSPDPHVWARCLMEIAGTTFDYEVIPF